jgi:hypothetical protein
MRIGATGLEVCVSIWKVSIFRTSHLPANALNSLNNSYSVRRADYICDKRNILNAKLKHIQNKLRYTT